MGETKKEKKVKGESWRGRDKPRARSRWKLLRTTYEIQRLVSIPESLSGKDRTERDAFRLSLLPRSSS